MELGTLVENERGQRVRHSSRRRQPALKPAVQSISRLRAKRDGHNVLLCAAFAVQAPKLFDRLLPGARGER